MRIIKSRSLARGKALVDYAYSNGGSCIDLEPADYVGIVAAYLNRGMYSEDIEKELGSLLNPEIGRRSRVTFDLFDDREGRGLWIQGPAVDDIAFVHPTLSKYYPRMSEHQARIKPIPLQRGVESTF